MAKTSLALSRVYRLLEPGPVVLVTTANRSRANVMPLSWHLMMEFEPPLIGCVLSGRNYSFSLLMESRECVINIPTRELARKVVACGNCSGRRRDKFATIGLTPVRSKYVLPPLIGECFANLECRVVDTRMVNRYNLFVLEVVQAWLDRAVARPRTLHHMGRGTFAVTGELIRLPSRKK
jgi:flavin reductase (DIM6/NTAB) family NADH-FMN oxidoreductase RutF